MHTIESYTVSARIITKFVVSYSCVDYDGGTSIKSYTISARIITKFVTSYSCADYDGGTHGTSHTHVLNTT